MGRTGRSFLPLIGTFGIFILLGNYMGLIPGLMAPTSNINVTLGCAITTWVYYHFHGVKDQGIVGYVKHFWAPPGAPWWIGFLYFPIEIISHAARVMSLSLRLFGNIFGEEMVILILFTLIPFLVPLPMMFLGLITGGAAGIHLRAAVDHLPAGRGGRRASRGRARTRRAERASGAGGGVVGGLVIILRFLTELWHERDSQRRFGS